MIEIKELSLEKEYLNLPRKQKKRIKKSTIFFDKEKQTVFIKYGKIIHKIDAKRFYKGFSNWTKDNNINDSDITSSIFQIYIQKVILSLKMN